MSVSTHSSYDSESTDDTAPQESTDPSTLKTQYKTIEMSGRVAMKYVADDDEGLNDTDSCIILLMGPTGVGKSNFIESLPGGKSLGISKDQLEGVTQQIVSYHLDGVEDVNFEGNIYIVDTPGFADRKISEMKITKMLYKWLEDRRKSAFDRILYFDRITDIRMSGSKAQNLDIFKTLIGEQAAKNITVVTTMWDLLWTEEQKEKAERRYQQLQDEHWKKFVDEGTRVVKFENTESSAMSIVDDSLATWAYDASRFERNKYKKNFQQAPFVPPLYRNLLHRVGQMQLRLNFIEEDLRDPFTQQNVSLRDILLQDKAEAEKDLKVALDEVEEFGAPPPGVDTSEAKEMPSFRSSSMVSFHYLFDTPVPKLEVHKGKMRRMVDKTKQKAKKLIKFRK